MKRADEIASLVVTGGENFVETFNGSNEVILFPFGEPELWAIEAEPPLGKIDHEDGIVLALDQIEELLPRVLAAVALDELLSPRRK